MDVGVVTGLNEFFVLNEEKKHAVQMALDDSPLVTVEVPKPYKMTLDDHRVVHVNAGVQDMKKYLADHWYSKANGVKTYKPKKSQPQQQFAEPKGEVPKK